MNKMDEQNNESMINENMNGYKDTWSNGCKVN